MSLSNLNSLVNNINGCIAMYQSTLSSLNQVKDGLPSQAPETLAVVNASIVAVQGQLDAFNLLKNQMSDAVAVAEM